MASAKEEILGRIRASLADHPNPPAPAREYRRRSDTPAGKVREMLVDRLEDYKAAVYQTDEAGLPGQIARLLTPTPDDLVILKPQHSAFHSTPLQHLLRRMHTRKLVIVGWAADMCVMLSATDARMLGHEVWTPRDCIPAETPERYELAVRQLGGPFDCSVRTAFRAAAGAAKPRARRARKA